MFAEWLNASKLSINTSKTKFIIFESKTKKYETKINLKINNNIIQQAAFVKFLGVIIDEKLTWKNHISSVHKEMIEASCGTNCKTTTYKQEYPIMHCCIHILPMGI